jgi:hypothetical protein
MLCGFASLRPCVEIPNRRKTLTQGRQDPKAQRGGAATKSISQKQTKETKNRKNFARNAEFSGIALRSAQSVFFIVLFSALRE